MKSSQELKMNRTEELERIRREFNKISDEIESIGSEQKNYQRQLYILRQKLDRLIQKGDEQVALASIAIQREIHTASIKLAQRTQLNRRDTKGKFICPITQQAVSGSEAIPVSNGCLYSKQGLKEAIRYQSYFPRYLPGSPIPLAERDIRTIRRAISKAPSIAKKGLWIGIGAGILVSIGLVALATLLYFALPFIIGGGGIAAAGIAAGAAAMAAIDIGTATFIFEIAMSFCALVGIPAILGMVTGALSWLGGLVFDSITLPSKFDPADVGHEDYDEDPDNFLKAKHFGTSAEMRSVLRAGSKPAPLREDTRERRAALSDGAPTPQVGLQSPVSTPMQPTVETLRSPKL